MKLAVVSVRAGRTPWADDACADYGRRIRRYFPWEEVLLKPGTAVQDGARVLAAVPPRGKLIALDERGDELSSEGLAALLEQGARESATALVFAIGGAHGHDPRVRDAAWRTIRLSRMVLNHAVARVVLVEQLYRACTIRAGEPYHHAGD